MAAVYSNPTNQVAILKELYVDDMEVMKDLVYKKNPFLALVPKNESPDGLAGKYFPIPTIYGTPQGRSNTFANAQNQQSAPADVSFFVFRASDYQVVTITNELLESTKGNAAAFIDAGKLNMDTGFRNISNNLARSLFASGTGTRGQIGTITTNGGSAAVTIQLLSPASVVQFEVNMLLVASTSDGGAPSSDTVLVTGVNRRTGIITGTASVNPSSGLSGNWTSTNPYLTVSGDVPLAGASNTSSYLAVVGLAGWIPIVAPASNDSFWNVNRSVDSRLYGQSFNGQSSTIEDAIIDGASQTAQEGGQPDIGFMNFQSYSALEKALGAKVQYVQVKHDMADIAFAGITVNAPYGPITIIPDRNCPPQTCYLLSMENWMFRSVNRAPHILTYGVEGLEGIRVGNADALEIRIGYYGNLCCNAPGWNCVIQLSQ